MKKKGISSWEENISSLKRFNSLYDCYFMFTVTRFYVKANGEETIKEDRKFEIKSVQEAGKSNNPDISVSTLDDNVKAEQLAKNSLVTEWKFEM